MYYLNQLCFVLSIIILFIVGILFVEHLDSDFIYKSSITWSPPSFYSNIIPHGSIPIYHVYVQNQDGSIKVDVNTADTFYQLPSNLTVCDSYDVSVQAFVKQYSSPVTSATKQNTGGKIIISAYCML